MPTHCGTKDHSFFDTLAHVTHETQNLITTTGHAEHVISPGMHIIIILYAIALLRKRYLYTVRDPQTRVHIDEKKTKKKKSKKKRTYNTITSRARDNKTYVTYRPNLLPPPLPSSSSCGCGHSEISHRLRRNYSPRFVVYDIALLFFLGFYCMQPYVTRTYYNNMPVRRRTSRSMYRNRLLEFTIRTCLAPRSRYKNSFGKLYR